MAIEVKVPMLPESITDATVSTWHKKAGDRVSRDENIVDLETDKVMLEVPSPIDGVIKEITKQTGTGKVGRITRENALAAVPNTITAIPAGARPEKRVPMTRIRVRIAERLLEVTQNTAMLTTFNEINMAPVMEMRNRYRDKFEKK